MPRRIDQPSLLVPHPAPAAIRVALAAALALWTLCAGTASAFASSSAAPDGDPFATTPLVLATLPESAIGTAVVEQDQPQIRARLLVDGEGPNRRAGVLFDLAPGWHIYWRNPGGTGLPPRIEFTAPGYAAGDLEWPAPRTFEEADGLFTTWGYEQAVLLAAPLARQEGAKPSQTSAEAVLEARVRALVCRTQCVPIELDLALPLDAPTATADRERVAALFRAERARVPRSSREAGVEASARWRGVAPAVDGEGTIELRVDACGDDTGPCPTLHAARGQALFVPMQQEAFEFSPARAIDGEHPDRVITLEVPTVRVEPGGDRLRGLVPIRRPDGRLAHVEIDVPIETGEALAPAALPTEAPPVVGETPTPAANPRDGAGLFAWLRILGLALLGGLILNGMPCVLPVLAIKVVAVADLAQKHPREVRIHGLAYTGGVLASMGVLAGVVIALRAAGHAVGWGFQFQEPLFVAAIAAILVTFAMNLFGVFEIELGQGRLAAVGQDATGARRSAFEGLLAVVLATPCTAPFLGTAVGFAFASDGPAIAAIFLAIGFGLASPFLWVSFQPSAARFIPRSGPWMNTLRAGLGFSLLATVVWLLWVLGQSGGASAIVSTTAVLLGLAFLLFCFGRLQPIRSLWVGRFAVLAIAAIAATGFNLIEFDRVETTPGAPAETMAGAETWRVYSEEAVAAAVADGQPAFVVFTADWCITCKMNESTVLEREAVRTAFARHGYALFQADWTRRDDRIRDKLAEFGRAGVPLYLVYAPGAPDRPRVLSELLSVQEVVTALAESADRGTS